MVFFYYRPSLLEFKGILFLIFFSNGFHIKKYDESSKIDSVQFGLLISNHGT